MIPFLNTLAVVWLLLIILFTAHDWYMYSKRKARYKEMKGWVWIATFISAVWLISRLFA